TQVDALSRKKAKQWHLSVDEWQRYKKLKQGFDGYLSDHLDPITLLGINARSTEERQRYARDLARLMHDHTERVLAFQKAYDKAFKSLYPNEQPVDTQSLGGALSQGQKAAQKLGLETARKAVVVRASDCEACQKAVQRLAAAHTPMDIFVIGAKTDDDIRA